MSQPEEVAEYAFEGIRKDQFWILPASEQTEAAVRARFESILNRSNPVLG